MHSAGNAASKCALRATPPGENAGTTPGVYEENPQKSTTERAKGLRGSF